MGIPAHVELWPVFWLFSAMPCCLTEHPKTHPPQWQWMHPWKNEVNTTCKPPASSSTARSADEHLFSASTIFSDASCAMVKQKRNVLKMSQLQMETPEGHRVLSISSHGWLHEIFGVGKQQLILARKSHYLWVRYRETLYMGAFGRETAGLVWFSRATETNNMIKTGWFA